MTLAPAGQDLSLPFETEDELDRWLERQEDEPASETDESDPEPISAETIEARYTKSQLRVVRTNIDFSLHNLRISLQDPNYINFSPYYQRRDRWDQKKQSLLIESFLMNIPIPPIFLFENRYNQYEVMDGRQRLEAIREFMADGYRLRGLEYWTELNGLKYSKLPQVIQSGLLRRTLSAIVLLAETAEQKDVSFDVRMLLFNRLNTGGVKLNNQELRNALYPSPFNNMLAVSARGADFTRIWRIPAYTPEEKDKVPEALQRNPLYRTMTDCELVLRFFAIREMIKEDLKGSLKRLLDDCLKRHQPDGAKQVSAHADEFAKALSNLSALFDGMPFVLPSTNRPSHTLYDSLCVAYDLGHVERELLPAEEIKARLSERLNDPEDYDILVNRFNTTDSIKARVKIASSVLFGSA